MDKFYENIDLSDVICENCSKIKFEKHHPVLNPPMQLIISLQRPEYNGVTDENSKIKQKFPFYHNIPCLFQVAMMKWFILWPQSSFMLVRILIVVTISVMHWITTQEHVGDLTITS